MVCTLSTFVLFYLCIACLPGTSYLSLSWNTVCHVSIFDRLLCKLLFLCVCDSENWAFPWQRMTLFNWKKLISGLFIPSCQKSWVFLPMERCRINKKILFFSLFFFSFFSYVFECVYIYLYTYIWGEKIKIYTFFPSLTDKQVALFLYSL